LFATSERAVINQAVEHQSVDEFVGERNPVAAHFFVGVVLDFGDDSSQGHRLNELGGDSWWVLYVDETLALGLYE